MKVFEFLPQLHLKYKGVFGPLLQTINYYIVYGKVLFEESKEAISLIFEMCNTSIFAKDERQMLSNNAEGAILFGLLL
jgi:hypothetical protein